MSNNSKEDGAPQTVQERADSGNGSSRTCLGAGRDQEKLTEQMNVHLKRYDAIILAKSMNTKDLVNGQRTIDVEYERIKNFVEQNETEAPVLCSMMPRPVKLCKHNEDTEVGALEAVLCYIGLGCLACNII